VRCGTAIATWLDIDRLLALMLLCFSGCCRDLLNEPRCAKCAPGTVAKWYADMASYVKSLDPNHLVTTGEEGFYGCCKNSANPGQPANGG